MCVVHGGPTELPRHRTHIGCREVSRAVHTEHSEAIEVMSEPHDSHILVRIVLRDFWAGEAGQVLGLDLSDLVVSTDTLG